MVNNTKIRITPIVPTEADAEYAIWQRSRSNFIAIARQIWVDGLLKNSIYYNIYHRFRLVIYKHDEVKRSWNLHLRPIDEPLLPEKGILELFEQNGRSLLILGDPATGKTTTLLQLMEGLLEVAEKEMLAPLPIIFNLSSWAKAKLSLVDWMVEEGLLQYGMARPLMKDWITKHRFIYLLDGLDEVAEAERKNCLEAINQFMAQHPAELVVCCRRKDYEEIQAKLNTRSAVYIQPLTPEQIEGYLQKFGEQTAGVRQMLKEDKDLQELAQSPLLLSLMVMAYKEAEIQSQLTTLDEKVHHLFTHYVARMFLHRPLPQNSIYTPEQALHWVMNLAYGLYKTNQSVFYIEYLQPSWLPNPKARTITRLVFGLITGLSIGLSIGLVTGLIFILFLGLSIGLINGLFFGLISGLTLALIFGLIEVNTIRLHEPLSFSLQTLGRNTREVFSTGLINRLDSFFQFVDVRPNYNINTPNISVWHMLKNGLIYGSVWGCISAVVAGLISGLVFWLNFGLSFGLVFGSVFALGVGLVFGLNFVFLQMGGEDFFNHYSLRFTLSYYNVLPYYFSDKRLIVFLDAMAERLLLRRIGGGWVFISRPLLEYFATQHPCSGKQENKTSSL